MGEGGTKVTPTFSSNIECDTDIDYLSIREFSTPAAITRKLRFRRKTGKSGPPSQIEFGDRFGAKTAQKICV